MTCTNNFRHK